VGLIDGIIDWFKRISGKSSTAKDGKPPKSFAPPFEKKPYDLRSVPDLNDIPKDLAQFCMRWFVASGMSIEGAAATVANLWRESYLNPAQLQIPATKPVGPGRGLAQWTDSSLTKRKEDDGRERWDHYRDKFFPSLKQSNKFWSRHVLNDLEPQLAYIVYEMKERFPSVWRNMETPGSVSGKAIIVLQKYEIARDRDKKEEQNLRANLAEKMYVLAKDDEKLKRVMNFNKHKPAPKKEAPNKEQPKKEAPKKQVPKKEVPKKKAVPTKPVKKSGTLNVKPKSKKMVAPTKRKRAVLKKRR
jgi:hypothetical protein